MSKQAPGGPIIDTNLPMVPNQPVDQRWNDRDFKTKLAPNRYPGGAQQDAYDFGGKRGEKLK